MSEATTLRVDQIVKTDNALRQVDTESEDFQEILASVKDIGILNPINVRRTSEEGVFDLVDGRHRLTAVTEAGLTEIPVLILDIVSDHDQLRAQLIANAVRSETKPAQFSAQIKRLLEDDEELTINDVAVMVNKSPQWVNQVLRLQKLPEPVQEQVDNGSMTLQNAIALADLPKDEQTEWLERALSMSVAEFVPLVTERAREIKEQSRAGREATPEVFKAKAVSRKAKDLLEEFETGCSTVLGLCSNGDQEAGAKLALAWVVQMDEETVMEAEGIWTAKKKARDEAKERRAKDKKAAAAEKATAKAAELTAALDATEG